MEHPIIQRLKVELDEGGKSNAASKATKLFSRLRRQRGKEGLVLYLTDLERLWVINIGPESKPSSISVASEAFYDQVIKALQSPGQADGGGEEWKFKLLLEDRKFQIHRQGEGSMRLVYCNANSREYEDSGQSLRKVLSSMLQELVAQVKEAQETREEVELRYNRLKKHQKDRDAVIREQGTALTEMRTSFLEKATLLLNEKRKEVERVRKENEAKTQEAEALRRRLKEVEEQLAKAERQVEDVEGRSGGGAAGSSGAVIDLSGEGRRSIPRSQSSSEETDVEDTGTESGEEEDGEEDEEEEEEDPLESADIPESAALVKQRSALTDDTLSQGPTLDTSLRLDAILPSSTSLTDGTHQGTKAKQPGAPSTDTARSNLARTSSGISTSSLDDSFDFGANAAPAAEAAAASMASGRRRALKRRRKEQGGTDTRQRTG